MNKGVLDKSTDPSKQRSELSVYIMLFGVAFVGMMLAFIPTMMKNQGIFLYYGDFNVQEIPFYRLAHDTILSGDIGWSHLTDLGSNFIGSYSFYLLGSPFFYLTLLLPSELVAYAFGPLLILKLGCCSLTAYIYLRRYVRDPRFAVIGGLLYAFSGFSVYNLFYFHFHEAMIVFPLLLAAFDEYHESGRKGVVALAVCACAVVNYYFFFGQVVFTLIYYLVKLLCGSYRFKLRQFLILAAECILGFLMSMVLLLPAITARPAMRVAVAAFAAHTVGIVCAVRGASLRPGVHAVSQGAVQERFVAAGPADGPADPHLPGIHVRAHGRAHRGLQPRGDPRGFGPRDGADVHLA